MIRVLFIAHHVDRPEAEIIRRLPDFGFQPLLIASERTPFKEALGYTKFVPFEIKKRVEPGALRLISKTIKEWQPQIIHSLSARGLTNALIATIAQRKIKHVSYRGTVGHLSRWDPSSWLSYLHPRLAKISCVSGAVADYLASLGIKHSKLAVIHKGHDPAWYSDIIPIPYSSFGIPADAFVISCTANMRPVKGVDILIAALKYLPEKAHLLLIGEVREAELLKISPELSQRIHFVGFQKKAPALVAGSHVFALPSRSREGLPKAVVEAMGVGVPVVASSVGGLPEIISHGETGLLVPPEEPEKLAKAIISILDSPELGKKLVSNATGFLCEQLNIKTTLSQTVGIYKELLSCNPPLEMTGTGCSV